MGSKGYLCWEKWQIFTLLLCRTGGRMPYILVRGCDIRQPISKLHLRSSASNCKRHLNSQQHTDTERSWDEEEGRRIASNKAEFWISPPFSTFRCHFWRWQFSAPRRWNRPQSGQQAPGPRRLKWSTERRQLRIFDRAKMGQGSLWLRRFYVPPQSNVVRLRTLTLMCGKNKLCIAWGNQKELGKTETERIRQQSSIGLV